jgi:DnaK suppressor protein
MKNKKEIKGVNGHNGANGHNGHNGHSNGHTNGHSNGHANGKNGHNGNGLSNGHNGIHAVNGTAAKEKGKIYRPTEKEPFMNERQKEYFRQKLAIWREDILKEAKDTLQHLQDENQNHPDLADRASSETDRAIELRARDRQRKLINKIDAALHRLDDGSYGYCEETGEPIGLKRLEARPIATLSVEAQERHERRERIYRDD